MKIKTFEHLALAPLCLCLVACSASKLDELQGWAKDERNQVHPTIPPVAEPKKFVPDAYIVDGLPDPFGTDKLAIAFRKSSAQATANAALVAPELNRRKEPLEAYTLDVMAMVGSVTKSGQPIALVRVDNLLYQVKVGNYLGQNYGKITKISETQVTVREIVQDATGDWVERMATLELQEKVK